jgi:hypothetical protein
MTTSWDEFDRLEQPPAAGEVLPYTGWGALVAWGLGPRFAVLTPRTPPLVRHDCDGHRWLAPPTAEDLADTDEFLTVIATRWGLPAPPLGWDFIAVLPASVSIDELTGATIAALEPVPVTEPAAEAAAALAAIDELLSRAGAG